jgi:hypothetical protein
MAGRRLETIGLACGPVTIPTEPFLPTPADMASLNKLRVTQSYCLRACKHDDGVRIEVHMVDYCLGAVRYKLAVSEDPHSSILSGIIFTPMNIQAPVNG